MAIERKNVSSLFTFKGRRNRTGFLFWVGILYGSSIATGMTLNVIAYHLGPSALTTALLLNAVATFINVLVIIAVMGIGAQRLHDFGATGWWQLIFLIPVLGLVLSIWMMIKRGDPEPNRYGPPPPDVDRMRFAPRLGYLGPNDTSEAVSDLTSARVSSA